MFKNYIIISKLLMLRGDSGNFHWPQGMEEITSGTDIGTVDIIVKAWGLWPGEGTLRFIAATRRAWREEGKFGPLNCCHC